MSSSNAEKFIGRVKWFNNKAGYGFVTVTDGSKSGSDVFIHHSAIKVDAEQYKYLVQGEYVEFTLALLRVVNTSSKLARFAESRVVSLCVRLEMS